MTRMGKNIYCKHQFYVSGKRVEVYPSVMPDSAIIFLNTFAEEGDKVYQALYKCGCPNFTLVAISELSWNHDMAPWYVPPISKNDTPCTGGADGYLRLLTKEIIPRAEELIQGRVLWRGLAGYSLAGLFAVYSLYQTQFFSRIASMSGSFWFPDFMEYVFSHELKKRPKCIYFSLGDLECQTKNPYLKTVQGTTEKIECFYAQRGIDTTFQLNPGNHYKNAVQRTVEGILWILSR